MEKPVQVLYNEYSTILQKSKKGTFFMKVTFLGQAGLLLQTDSCTVMIDPYLSDSVEKVNPANYRRVPVDPRFFDIRPDVMIFTHNHLDHYDPETAPVFFKKYRGMTVLAPSSVWGSARQEAPGHNYVLFDRHTRWTEYGLTFKAVKACHSDDYAIGVIVDDGEKKYYITGDTLYNEEIFKDLPNDIDVVFLPINGVGNNMNMADAAAFFRKTGAKKAVPIHTGMFDQKNALLFPVEEKVVPTIYEEIEL